MVKRRKYDRQFKLDLCKMVLEDDISINSIAREYDLSITMLQRWMREFRAYGENAFPGRGIKMSPDGRIKELEKEVQELKMEIEILKKTKNHFLQQQHKR